MRTLILTALVGYSLLHIPYRLILLTGYVLTQPATLVQMPNTNGRYWDAQDLTHRLHRLGWTVEYKSPDTLQGAYGITYLETREIFVDESLSWDARYWVLAHEAGHTLQPGWANHGHGEAWAETVSALITKEGFAQHAKYIARVKGEYLLMVLTEYKQLYRAVAVMETL
jgi:hypothetical protein